jgi:translation initiation factor IF-3
MPVEEAISLANEADLDLVEVAPDAKPPVCRIMDYGKYKYRQKKRHHDSKKKSHAGEIKELRLRPKIEDHDFNVKLKKARQFLEAGQKVVVNVFFRGREITHKEFGLALLKRVADAVEDIARVEGPPREEGRKVGFTLIRK